MGPKREKNKDKEEGSRATGAFTEVEKTFLELQITECNRKIARLRTAVDEYEVKNEELQKAYDKLDEDRADIIAYLKKTLNLKNEENSELKEKVKGLEEIREIETARFKETVTELERNFTVMKDQLTSENKLLAGKLNTLEEFRAIRDDLMKKFEKQEQDFKDQEMKYKRVIYDAEKKFVIGKDKLKKEMEARLLQLAQDFQDATELRIAASTHRVIRENIAINNELDSILTTQAKLAEQNEKYKESEKAARVAQELAEEERDKAINKNVVQLKVIDQLTTAFQDIKNERGHSIKKEYDFELLETKVENLSKENDSLSLKVRILEQNLHARLSDQNKSFVETSLVFKECAKLKRVLKEAAIAVRAALKLDGWATKDPKRDVVDRQVLLTRLLDIITRYQEIEKADSMETLASLGEVYEEGDLGFIPKVTKKKSATSVSSSESRDKSVRVDHTSSVSIAASSLASLKTIPSAKLVPHSTEHRVSIKDSLPSFVTSSKSYLSSSEIEDEHVPESEMNIEQKLEASKLEIQKSILKDLQYSQMVLQSQSRVISDKNITSKLLTLEEQDVEKIDIQESDKNYGDIEDKSGVKISDENITQEELDDQILEDTAALEGDAP